MDPPSDITLGELKSRERSQKSTSRHPALFPTARIPARGRMLRERRPAAGTSQPPARCLQDAHIRDLLQQLRGGASPPAAGNSCGPRGCAAQHTCRRSRDRTTRAAEDYLLKGGQESAEGGGGGDVLAAHEEPRRGHSSCTSPVWLRGATRHVVTVPLLATVLCTSAHSHPEASAGVLICGGSRGREQELPALPGAGKRWCGHGEMAMAATSYLQRYGYSV